jgi:heat shock protein HslJ
MPSRRTFVGLGFLVLATGSLAASPLAGTEWQLHAIQSMDDAQGTTKIADPSRFTVHFGVDGRASFQLDCNRGMGDWKVESAGDESGKLTFGPIAATRALCPPPNIDERVAVSACGASCL